MVESNYKGLVDWNNDGDWADTGEDVTANLRAYRSFRGRDLASNVIGRSIGGTLAFDLNNQQSTGGDYSSFNASSPITGNILPNRKVKLLMQGRAAQFTLANSEFLSGGDVLDITTGDFSLAGWLYIDSLATAQGIVNKRDRASGTNLGYAVELQTDGTLDLLISDGTSVTTISSTTTFSLATWYFWVLTADRDGNAQFYIDAGAAEGAASIVSQNGTLANAIAFQLGAGLSTSADRFYGGRMVAVGIWSKLLSSAERTWLYNDGNGRNYTVFGLLGDGSAIKTSLEAHWELKEESGTRVDSENANDLSDNATVTAADGIYNWPRWEGFLEDIQPLPGINHANMARLSASGPLAWINRKKTSVAMGSSKRTDTSYGDILDDLGWPTNDRVLNTGQTTMDRFWVDRILGLAAMRQVEATENGFLWETVEARIAGHDRWARLVAPFTTSQATFTDANGGALAYSTIKQIDPRPFIFNTFETHVSAWTAQSIATLWTLNEVGGNSTAIPPGDSRTYWAEFPNPQSATNAVSVDAWTTPAAVTDYDFDSASGGGGTDLTASVAIAVNKFANSMEIIFTNNHASLPAFPIAVKARGTALHVEDPVLISKTDSTSATKYGAATRINPSEFLPSTDEATDWCNWGLAVAKDPVPYLEMTFNANRSQGHMAQARERDVNDRITLTANDTSGTGLGINEDFFIEAIRERIDSQKIHWVTFLLSQASVFSDWWVWGFAQWGTTTRWAY